MATYGTRDATQFLLPSVESNERYYTLVDRDTGKITLKRINKLNILNESLDATVGTIESSDLMRENLFQKQEQLLQKNKLFPSNHKQ